MTDYHCDTCGKLLNSGEGYALNTKQIIVSSESWRRVLLTWKRQICAQANQAKYIPKANDVSNRGFLFVTKNRDKNEHIAEIMRCLAPKFDREYSKVFADFAIYLAFGRATSNTSWGICESCASIFNFDQNLSKAAMQTFWQTGQCQTENPVLTLEIPKPSGRIWVKSNDDETLIVMLNTIDIAMSKNLEE